MLHLLGQLANGVGHLLLLIGFFVHGVEFVILGLILVPISLFLFAMIIRVSAELVVSVLLAPFLLAAKQSRQGPSQVVDDLGSFGVQAGGVAVPMAGTSV